jgi:hypothetical protein
MRVQALILALSTFALAVSSTAFAYDPREFPRLFGAEPRYSTSLPDGEVMSERLNEQIQSVELAGFHRLEYRWGEDSYHQLDIVIQEDRIAGPLNPVEFAQALGDAAKPHDKEALKTIFRLTETEYQAALSGEFAKRFVTALGEYKQTLMQAYNLSDSQYNKLAVVAFGILGVETKFTGSLKYKGKEQLPGLVKLGKQLKQFSKILKQPNVSLKEAWDEAGQSVTINSRGGTQIKRVPTKIYQMFQVGRRDLDEPEWSAVATLGFLADSLAEIRIMAHNAQPDGKLLFINEENIYDYIPFIYLGKSTLLKNGTADAAKEPYVKGIRENMQFLGLYER